MEAEAILTSADWINAGGLYLILVGIALLIAEFFIPSFGLLGFAGVAAGLIGVIQLYQTGYIDDLPINMTLMITFITISVLFSALGGWYSWHIYRKKNTTGTEAMLGETARVLTWKAQNGRIHIQGEDWQAYSDEKLDLKKDDSVTVSKIENLKIKITPQK